MMNRLQVQREDVRQIGTSGLTVDGTLVEPRVLPPSGVDGVDVDHGKWAEKDLGRGLDQLAVTSVPAGTVQEKAVNVHT